MCIVGGPPGTELGTTALPDREQVSWVSCCQLTHSNYIIYPTFKWLCLEKPNGGVLYLYNNYIFHGGDCLSIILHFCLPVIPFDSSCNQALMEILQEQIIY